MDKDIFMPENTADISWKEMPNGRSLFLGGV